MAWWWLWASEYLSAIPASKGYFVRMVEKGELCMLLYSLWGGEVKNVILVGVKLWWHILLLNRWRWGWWSDYCSKRWRNESYAFLCKYIYNKLGWDLGKNPLANTFYTRLWNEWEMHMITPLHSHVVCIWVNLIKFQKNFMGYQSNTFMLITYQGFNGQNVSHFFRVN